MVSGEMDMHTWLEMGVPIIIWLQSLGDWLITPMQFFTFLGDQEFYLILMPAILWCFDVGLGLRIGIIFLFSSTINGALKLVSGLPRPYWVSTEVRALKAANGFGLPSGHAQSAVAVWGTMAAWLKRRWTTLAMILLIFLISISRIVLAVHFPLDTLAGWLIGALILAGALLLEKPLIRWLRHLNLIQQIGFMLFASLTLIALGLIAHTATAARPVPQAWIAAAQVAIPQSDKIDPRNLNDFFSAGGTFFGVGVGAALLFAWGRFNARVPWEKRAARYVLGIIVIIALYYGLKLVFPGGQTLLGVTFRFIRYALVGFWATYGAPRLFVALRLE
jgi:membrane-associated phospholipid phosphatase